jgi:hypothetical protein
MALIQGAGEKTVLPQVPRAAVHAVDVSSVEVVGASQRLGQRVLPLGRGNEVNVIGHQTIGVQDQAELLGVSEQQLQVDLTVIVNEEHILTIVAPLRDMMRAPRNDGSGDSWHSGQRLQEYKLKRNVILLLSHK